MTREETIHELGEWLEQIIQHGVPSHSAKRKALATAIALLSAEPEKTYIGIDIPYGSDKGIATIFKRKDDKLILEEVKEIMAVVRCKDCKFRRTDNCAISSDMCLDAHDYCAFGERK